MGAIQEGPVLVEACPGAGKTRFALEVAYQLVCAFREKDRNFVDALIAQRPG